MGQYWMVVNLDKREFVDPHKLGAGLKLWEQLAAHPGTGTALIILCAAMPEPRGGGDFDMDENWHGPERIFPEHNTSPAPMPEDYQTVAARTIGRWAGDRIALVGDYAEDGDLYNGLPRPSDTPASIIYALCREQGDEVEDDEAKGYVSFTDVSDDVARVIEHELNGQYTGDGWRHWVSAEGDR